jgi:hypothetical protein
MVLSHYDESRFPPGYDYEVCRSQDDWDDSVYVWEWATDNIVGWNPYDGTKTKTITGVNRGWWHRNRIGFDIHNVFLYKNGCGFILLDPSKIGNDIPVNVVVSTNSDQSDGLFQPFGFYNFIEAKLGVRGVDLGTKESPLTTYSYPVTADANFYPPLVNNIPAPSGIQLIHNNHDVPEDVATFIIQGRQATDMILYPNENSTCARTFVTTAMSGIGLLTIEGLEPSFFGNELILRDGNILDITPTGILYSAPNYITQMETSHTQLAPYIFADYENHFYQRDAGSLTFAQKNVNNPTSKVTIIRIDSSF